MCKRYYFGFEYDNLGLHVYLSVLSLSLPVYQVKLDCFPLYCLDSAQPAGLPQKLSWYSGCLVNSISWVRIPLVQLFFCWKK